MKILILRFSSIGDIVLTTPVVRCLKKKYPDAEIHYATKKAFHSVLQHNPYINKLHLLGDSFDELTDTLKQENYDYIIDLHNNQRTLLLKLRLGVKAYSFNKLNVEKWLMVNFKINRLPDKHIVDRYLETCAPLGVTNDGEGLDYFLGQEDKVDITTLPEAFHNGYISWVIGAKQNTKKFPAAKVASAINALTMPVLLLGGKEDNAEAETIIQQVKAGVPLFNAAGKHSLNQSASLVQQARLVVANDTGLMHMAAAFKRPLITLWGNTIPQFGMYPCFGKHNVPEQRFQVEGLACRPCSKLGYSACPKGHFRCMNDIDEKRLASAILAMWGL
jgi:ADP-heptose:LPS heptosyltransferase